MDSGIRDLRGPADAELGRVEDIPDDQEGEEQPSPRDPTAGPIPPSAQSTSPYPVHPGTRARGDEPPGALVPESGILPGHHPGDVPADVGCHLYPETRP